MNEKWTKILSILDFAFQPIVNAHSGVVYGFEALLRHTEKAGFSSIDACFDTAYSEGVLYMLDLELRHKVIKKFRTLIEQFSLEKYSGYESIKLFYNIDSRILEENDYRPGNTKEILEKINFPLSNFCFEISEKFRFSSFTSLRTILTLYKQQGFSVALDDFGTGFSGFELMFHAEPTIVKIDKSYIKNIPSDSRKRAYCTHMTRIAHSEGAIVIAEGVEKEEELAVAQAIGCDFIQGYLIARPTIKLSDLLPFYPVSAKHYMAAENDAGIDTLRIESFLDRRRPLEAKTPIKEVVELLSKAPISSYPVVDRNNRPLGVIEEKKIKKYLYALYGRELIQNHPISRYVSLAPIVEINATLDNIISLFSDCEDLEGIVVVQNGIYKGYLNTRTLIHLIHDKKIEEAANLNPLTYLPGNHRIREWMDESLSNDTTYRLIGIIDLDNFKPFNDRFGFVIGDRAILLLSRLLRDFGEKHTVHIGHIGGDDFCIFATRTTYNEIANAQTELRHILRQFAKEATHYYESDERKKGFFTGIDRFGEKRHFPLLSASLACISIKEGDIPLRHDFDSQMQTLKKVSKIEGFAHLLWDNGAK